MGKILRNRDTLCDLPALAGSGFYQYVIVDTSALAQYRVMPPFFRKDERFVVQDVGAKVDHFEARNSSIDFWIDAFEKYPSLYVTSTINEELSNYHKGGKPVKRIKQSGIKGGEFTRLERLRRTYFRKVNSFGTFLGENGRVLQPTDSSPEISSLLVGVVRDYKLKEKDLSILSDVFSLSEREGNVSFVTCNFGLLKATNSIVPAKKSSLVLDTYLRQDVGSFKFFSSSFV